LTARSSRVLAYLPWRVLLMFFIKTSSLAPFIYAVG